MDALPIAGRACYSLIFQYGFPCIDPTMMKPPNHRLPAGCRGSRLSALAGLLALLLAAPGPAGAAADSPSTYCNPLPAPNYPVGRSARTVTNGDPLDDSILWLLGHMEQYRELADPSALWLDGKWYLYPSCDMAWVSADNGATWQHHPLNIRDAGYAPTVVKHGNRFLLLASESPVYVSDSPLGPFTELGKINFEGIKVPATIDPMLFSDDDGRLYFYWGCSKNGGIWGVELDKDNPLKIVGRPAEVIPFRPDIHPWERTGEWNQNPNDGWMEGAWMIKVNGTYYLTYSAAGTQVRTYAMGCYSSKSPLGPFTPQKTNPILRTTDGLVTGTAHGCVVRGPEDKLWVFYTIRAGVAHGFERRIGIDRAEIDTRGELTVPGGATSLPQWLPGKGPGNAAGTGWIPLNGVVLTIGSSCAPNLPGRLAVDNELRTWWQPGEDDKQPILTSRFLSPATVKAARIVWRDIGLNTKKGAKPGPFKYCVEVETEKDKWTTVIDRTGSDEDLLVDYRECKPTTGTRARLVITGWPQGITPGVAEFTVFGETLKAP